MMHPWQMDTLAELNKLHHEEMLREAAQVRARRKPSDALSAATGDEKSGHSAQQLVETLLALPARFRTA